MTIVSCALFICADLIRVSALISLIANLHSVKFSLNPKSFDDSMIQ